jgi:hypothetical protein
MDRNKDGFITKGELKLAKKKMSMKEVEEVKKSAKKKYTFFKSLIKILN